jgi:hypothetical protein
MNSRQIARLLRNGRRIRRGQHQKPVRPLRAGLKTRPAQKHGRHHQRSNHDLLNSRDRRYNHNLSGRLRKWNDRKQGPLHHRSSRALLNSKDRQYNHSLSDQLRKWRVRKQGPLRHRNSRALLNSRDRRQHNPGLSLSSMLNHKRALRLNPIQTNLTIHIAKS